jgi:hypothetical protein
MAKLLDVFLRRFTENELNIDIWFLNGHFSTVTLVPVLFRQFESETTFVLTPKTLFMPSLHDAHEMNARMAVCPSVRLVEL